MRPTASWKAWERRGSGRFGLKRRGADYGTGNVGEGKNDAVEPDGSESRHWSLEFKLAKKLGYKAILDACKQAEAAACEGQEPVAIVKLPHLRDDDALVVQRLATFTEWRLPSPQEDDGDASDAPTQKSAPQP